MGAKKCKDYEVYMTDQCRREYRRACKRMDSGLRGAIESELDKLRGDPRRGDELERDLDGMRSIHINGFSHRMVYDVDSGARRVTVHAIRHRNSVYRDLARRAQPPERRTRPAVRGTARRN